MNKGFTLIELLVVVLIIGILSAVALPQYQKTVEKARATEMINYASTWKKAQNIYRLETGSYSHNLEDLSIKMPELKYFGAQNWGSSLYIIGCGNFRVEGIDAFRFYIYEDGTMYGSCEGPNREACRRVLPCNGRDGCSM